MSFFKLFILSVVLILLCGVGNVIQESFTNELIESRDPTKKELWDYSQYYLDQVTLSV